jgi:hypothetical protein
MEMQVFALALLALTASIPPAAPGLIASGLALVR